MSSAPALAKIAQEIQSCKICRVGKSGLSVPGEGNPRAQIVFIGEAPGRQEAKVGRPFVGRSGQLLRQLIRQVWLKESDVFITSPVKYLPNRGTPTLSDIKHGMIHTQKQLDVIKPNMIVLLGSVAAQGVLGEKIPINKQHGKIIKKSSQIYLVTFHPAAALRFPPLKKLLEEDFRKLRTLIK